MTLYFLLTETTPPGNDAQLTLPGDLPMHRGLAAVVNRCLARSPADRVQTARELYVGLEQLLVEAVQPA